MPGLYLAQYNTLIKYTFYLKNLIEANSQLFYENKEIFITFIIYLAI
jgi:hypothetical protein